MAVAAAASLPWAVGVRKSSIVSTQKKNSNAEENKELSMLTGSSAALQNRPNIHSQTSSHASSLGLN